MKESPTIGTPANAKRANQRDVGGDDFRSAMERYVEHMLRLGADLLRLFSLALGLDEDHLGTLAHHPDSEFKPQLVT